MKVLIHILIPWNRYRRLVVLVGPRTEFRPGTDLLRSLCQWHLVVDRWTLHAWSSAGNCRTTSSYDLTDSWVTRCSRPRPNTTKCCPTNCLLVICKHNGGSIV